MSRRGRQWAATATDLVRAPFLWACFLVGAGGIVWAHVRLGPPWTLLVAVALLLTLVPATLLAQLCWDFYTWRSTDEPALKDDPQPAGRRDDAGGGGPGAAQPD